METDTSLSKELEKIDKLELQASIQVKKGRCYAVISYTEKGKKSKPVWRATGLTDTPKNKKIARNSISEIIQKFKEELKSEAQKKYAEEEEKNNISLEPMQLQIEYENSIDNIEDNSDIGDGLDKERKIKYNNMSFVEFIKDSLEEFKRRIAITTYDSWYSCWKSRLSDYFRVIPLNKRYFMMNPNIEKPMYYNETPKLVEITQFDIEDFIKWLYDCNLKGSSVDKYYELLNLVFLRAIRKKIIKKENNPMADVPKPKVDPYVADYYRPSELKQLFDIVKDDILEVPILFAGTYGLRRSEVLGIRWKAIDFEANTFVVSHVVNKVTGKGENQVIFSKDLPKSKYGYRTYPLTDEVRKALIKQKMNIEFNKRYLFKDKYVKQTEEYVCVKENGEIIKPDHFTTRFKLLIREHELRRIRLHDVRHSVGSLLAAKNVNLRQIQDFLGHGSIRSTERYSHLQFEGKQNSIAVINAAISV